MPEWHRLVSRKHDLICRAQAWYFSKELVAEVLVNSRNRQACSNEPKACVAIKPILAQTKMKGCTEG